MIKMIDSIDFKGFQTFIFRKPISVEYKPFFFYHLNDIGGWGGKFTAPTNKHSFRANAYKFIFQKTMAKLNKLIHVKFFCLKAGRLR